MDVLKLGTRRSMLAWAQSSWVARELEKLHPGLKVELVGIDTRGDKILDIPLSKVEGKEFFVAELDNAIRNRLKKMGKSAKNWTIVSSDRRVQQEARAVQAEVITSDSFANILKQARNSAPKPTTDRKLSQQELDDWLNLFRDKQA